MEQRHRDNLLGLPMRVDFCYRSMYIDSQWVLT
jgi:hypothetical protein